jgi:hypothetical protein
VFACWFPPGGLTHYLTTAALRSSQTTPATVDEFVGVFRVITTKIRLAPNGSSGQSPLHVTAVAVP